MVARVKLSKVAAREKGGQLIEACRDKNATAALRLIDEGADVDCIHVETGYTPLMLAVSAAELKEVAERLIATGANLDFVEKGGWSALMFACASSRAGTAMLLIEAGAQLNLASPLDLSALVVAVNSDLPSVAAAIRARGGRTGAELKAASRA